jgi:hypothetical protein
MPKSYDDYISDIDQKVDELIKKAEAYMYPNIPKKKIRSEIVRAYEYSKEAHKDQKRLS